MKILLFISIFIISTGCDPSFHLFVSNETNQKMEVKVLVSENNLPKKDSIKFFNSLQKINWRSYDSSSVSRKIIIDTIEGSYTFFIEPGEITLLQPITIVTFISYIVINNDTTFFYSKEKVPRDKRFSKIGQFKYIKRIK